MKTMKYGGVSVDEQEVVIRLDRATGEAHVSSAWPDYSRRLEKVHGAPKRCSTRGDWVTVAFWTFPVAYVRTPKQPRKGRSLTPEQAAAMKSARKSQDRTRNTMEMEPMIVGRP